MYYNIILQDGISSPKELRNRMSFCARTSAPQPPDDGPLAFIRYNPILGEFFRCKYQYPDGTKGFYIAEQGKDPSLRLQIRPYSQTCFCCFCVYSSGLGGDTCGPCSSH